MSNNTTRREIVVRPNQQHEDCSFGASSSSGGCKSRTHDVIVDRRGTTSQFECREKRRLFIRRSHHTPLLLVGGATVSVLAVTIAVIQLHAYIVEYQGPLDHIIATAVEPYYDMFCPKISNNNDDETLLEDSYYDYNDQSTINLVLSWDCNGGGPTIVDTTFPRIFMIGARDVAEDTFQEWNTTLNRMNYDTMNHDVVGKVDKSHSSPRLERINTLDISNQYATSGNKLCRKTKWEHRLFAVYQYIFTNLLVTYPNDSGFVIIEDDAILRNVNYLIQDVCYAQRHKLDFYSLYRSPVQLRKRWRSWWEQHSSSSSSSLPSCIYQHGTVAFYIRRTMMEKIVNEHRRNYFCRFPIDMYISKHGPWYATRREIVGHSDMGRVGST